MGPSRNVTDRLTGRALTLADVAEDDEELLQLELQEVRLMKKLRMRALLRERA